MSIPGGIPQRKISHEESCRCCQASARRTKMSAGSELSKTVTQPKLNKTVPAIREALADIANTLKSFTPWALNRSLGL